MHTWMKAEFRKILKPSCLRNKVRHKPSCSEALQQHALWERWQEGLQRKFTLPQELPPLRMLLVLDNLVGHKSAEMVLWWVKHGIMPLSYSDQRILLKHG